MGPSDGRQVEARVGAMEAEELTGRGSAGAPKARLPHWGFTAKGTGGNRPCPVRVVQTCGVKIRINGELRGTPRVRVFGSSDEQFGVMTLSEALRLAMKNGLDLVEINRKADPPLCKIMDFAKYRSGKPKE